MSAELLLLVESKKKSGLIAALLNLFFPGFGYIYCGNWILGIVAFAFTVTMAVITLGVALIPMGLLLVIDGALCARRYNRKLIERVIGDQAKLKAASA
jgi:magnesium-transporting ATPase (P-type)